METEKNQLKKTTKAHASLFIVFTGLLIAFIVALVYFLSAVHNLKQSDRLRFSNAHAEKGQDSNIRRDFWIK